MHPLLTRWLKILGIFLISTYPLSVLAKVEIDGSSQLEKIKREDVVRRLKRGVTTQAEVADWLGARQTYPACMPPQSRPRAAHEAWTFCWAKYTYRWWSSVRLAHFKKLEITFDEMGLVHDFAFEDYFQENDESGSGQFISLRIFLWDKSPHEPPPADPHTALTRAVYDNNWTRIEELLKHGENPNEPNYEGKTPLSIAARFDTVWLFEELLAHGASFKNVEQPPGGLPYKYVARRENVLRTAIEQRTIKIVRLLLARGVDVNDDVFFRAEHTTALREAVRSGSRDMVDLLLAAGADPNVYAQDSDPILMLAVKKNDLPLVQRLLDAGARRDDRNPFSKQTALSEAKRLGLVEIEALLQSPDPVLVITAACRGNAACYFEGKELFLDIRITNNSKQEIGFPLLFVRERGPMVRLIDARTRAEIWLKNNPASPDLKEKFTPVQPGESVIVPWVIHASELLSSGGMVVDVYAEIAVQATIQTSAQRLEYRGGHTLRIVSKQQR